MSPFGYGSEPRQAHPQTIHSIELTLSVAHRYLIYLAHSSFQAPMYPKSRWPGVEPTTLDMNVAGHIACCV